MSDKKNDEEIATLRAENERLKAELRIADREQEEKRAEIRLLRAQATRKDAERPVPRPEKIAGYLEVGHTEDTHEVVINHPNLDVDENGCGHIVFSPAQARNLAVLLIEHAHQAEANNG